MLDSARKIMKSMRDVEYSDFIADEEKQAAVIRFIEIIGEAAKNVSEKTRKQHPEIPWRMVAGTRDRLIHGYFSVDIDIVWGIVRRDIPNLMLKLEKIYEECREVRK